MPPPNTPLPLAPDRAALSNRISLLISNKSSLLKTLNPPSSSRPAAAQSSKHTAAASASHNLDDEELWKGNSRPNEGVGYVSDKPARDATKEDRMLRGKLLGKRKGGASALGSRKLPESESDEEEGRSSLGKRKRLRNAPPAAADSEAETSLQNSTGSVDSAARIGEATGRVDKDLGDSNEPVDVTEGGSGGDAAANSAAAIAVPTEGPQGVEGGKAKKQKKKKNKTKKKLSNNGS